MPVAAPKSCKTCGAVVRDGGSRCELHKVRDGTFADRRRGTRHERGYGTEWDKLRPQVLARDAGLCQVCLIDGLVTISNIVDHIIPKAEGGTDDMVNLDFDGAYQRFSDWHGPVPTKGFKRAASHTGGYD